MDGGQLQRDDSDTQPHDPHTEPLSRDEIDEQLMLPSWELHLVAKGLAMRTIGEYLKDARYFAEWLHRNGLPLDPPRWEKAHFTAYLAHGLQRGLTTSSVASWYRRLLQLCVWYTAEGEVPANPMAGLDPPEIIDNPPRIVTDQSVLDLLGVMGTTSFDDRRDTAITRGFFDTGMRVGSMASLQLIDPKDRHAATTPHPNLRERIFHIRQKGGTWNDVPFGSKTAEALDRYLRARNKHPKRHDPGLWLGLKGQLTESGIYQMTVRRAAQAKIEHIHPHLWRHYLAHHWLLNDGNETDLQHLMGWASGDMVSRYARSAAGTRARQAHQRKALGDRF